MRCSFAITREDPITELAVADRFNAERALLVASGGCTAFAFTALRPQTELTLYDLNPAQLDHVEQRRRSLNDPVPAGAFEHLFHLLATGFHDLIADTRPWFETGAGDPEAWLASPYWPALCHSTFHDQLLLAMFGPDAVQHAEPGSYPTYFQRVIESGLRRDDAARNPFLQYLFLGEWLDPLPRRAPPRPYTTVLGELPDVPDLDRFDLVHLSNIFDWSSPATTARWAEALKRLRPGAVITVRQLNNQRELDLPGFDFDETFAAELLKQDRSLFYERLHVGVRR